METLLGIDYPTWWFLVVGALFSGYAVLDGFDFGAGAWHLFFRKDESRRIAINASIGHTREDLVSGRPMKFWRLYKYLIIYRVDRTPIEVLAIVHGARDVASLMRER